MYRVMQLNRIWDPNLMLLLSGRIDQMVCDHFMFVTAAPFDSLFF
jgi:hypothetical protein